MCSKRVKETVEKTMIQYEKRKTPNGRKCRSGSRRSVSRKKPGYCVKKVTKRVKKSVIKYIPAEGIKILANIATNAIMDAIAKVDAGTSTEPIVGVDGLEVVPYNPPVMEPEILELPRTSPRTLLRRLNMRLKKASPQNREIIKKAVLEIENRLLEIEDKKLELEDGFVEDEYVYKSISPIVRDAERLLLLEDKLEDELEDIQPDDFDFVEAVGSAGRGAADAVGSAAQTVTDATGRIITGIGSLAMGLIAIGAAASGLQTEAGRQIGDLIAQNPNVARVVDEVARHASPASAEKALQAIQSGAGADSPAAQVVEQVVAENEAVGAADNLLLNGLPQRTIEDEGIRSFRNAKGQKTGEIWNGKVYISPTSPRRKFYYREAPNPLRRKTGRSFVSDARAQIRNEVERLFSIASGERANF